MNLMLILSCLVFLIHGSLQDREHILSDIASEIAGRSNASRFSVEEIQKIFTKIGFKNCSTETVSTNCQLCLGVHDLLLWQGYQKNSSLNRTELRKFFPSILYSLTPIPKRTSAVCNISLSRRAKNFSSDSTAFQSLLRQYGGTSKLTEKQIDSLLDDINVTISTRLTKKPCFDVDSALTGSGVPESGANANDFEHLSGFIILQLMKGRCIAKHEHGKSHSNLPAPKAFMDALFKEFAHNGTMSLSKFESLLGKLGIGKSNAKTTTVTPGHEGHNHRRKRSLEFLEDERLERRRRSVSSPSISGKCYSPENLFAIHSFNKTAGISQDQFKNICPSLVQQIESGACKSAAKKSTSKLKQQGWKPWVSSIVAVLIISFGSLIGILVAPFSQQKSFTLVLTFLIALAVSTLLGDALLHLFPHALDLHKHDANTPHVSTTSKNSFIWKSLVFIVGIYAFYIFESIMHSMQKHGHSHGLQETHQHVGKGRSHSVVSGPVEMIQERKRDADHGEGRQDHLIKTVSGIHKCDETNCLKMEEMHSKNLDNSEVYVNTKNSGESNSNVAQFTKNGHSRELDYQDRPSNNGHSHNGYTVHDSNKKKTDFKSVAWMVLFGDAIHNFMDGIAIGVAFTDKFPTGFYGGISTSIAILCHEMPHELGDFAILIQSGLSIKAALLLNFLSSLTAILGCLIGVSLGQTFDASSWIFAVTAGLFVYIALVDMLPELIHNGELRHSPCKTMLIQNAGLYLGFGLMLCLAIFEESIKV